MTMKNSKTSEWEDPIDGSRRAGDISGDRARGGTGGGVQDRWGHRHRGWGVEVCVSSGVAFLLVEYCRTTGISLLCTLTRESHRWRYSHQNILPVTTVYSYIAHIHIRVHINISTYTFFGLFEQNAAQRDHYKLLC